MVLSSSISTLTWTSTTYFLYIWLCVHQLDTNCLIPVVSSSSVEYGLKSLKTINFVNAQEIVQASVLIVVRKFNISFLFFSPATVLCLQWKVIYICIFLLFCLLNIFLLQACWWVLQYNCFSNLFVGHAVNYHDNVTGSFSFTWTVEEVSALSEEGRFSDIIPIDSEKWYINQICY